MRVALGWQGLELHVRPRRFVLFLDALPTDIWRLRVLDMPTFASQPE